jgi:hypothetical protein
VQLACNIAQHLVRRRASDRPVHFGAVGERVAAGDIDVLVLGDPDRDGVSLGSVRSRSDSVDPSKSRSGRRAVAVTRTNSTNSFDFLVA